MIGWKTNIVLLFFIILIVFLFFIIQSEHKDNIIKNYRIIPSNIDDLNTITFITSSNNIICTTINKLWRVGDSQDSLKKADHFIVKRLIDSISNIKLLPIIDINELNNKELILSDFGLDNPIKELLIHSDNRKVTWKIGSKSIIDNYVYLMRENHNIIYKASIDLISLFPSNTQSLQDMKLVSNIDGIIERIDMNGDVGFIQLLRNPDKGWSLSQPREGILKRLEVYSFIESLRQYKIENFLDEVVLDYSIYGLEDHTGLKVDLSGISGPLYSFIVGNEVPGKKGYRYARRESEDRVVIISNSVYDDINSAIKRFRTTQVFDFDSFDPNFIHLSDKYHNIILNMNEDRSWYMKSPFNWDVESKSIQDFLKYLEDIKITKFNTNPLKNLMPVSLIVSSDLKDQKITCYISQNTNDSLFIQFNKEQAIHEVNKPQMIDKYLSPLFFKSKKIFNFLPQDIEEIEILNLGTNNIIHKKNINDNFLKTLANLNAESYIAAFPSSLNEFKLDNPWCIIKIYFTKNNYSSNELLIGNKTLSGRYAMIKGRDIVFSLKDDIIDLLISPN